MKLTKEDVLVKAGASSLSSVRNLNCWGSKITDLSILQEMPNLEVLSLSVNEVSSMKYLTYCPKLKELYLRKNCLTDLNEVAYLTSLPNLHNLWMSDNPCTSDGSYRLLVIKLLENLTRLDNIDITAEERDKAMLLSQSLKRKENLPNYNGLDLSMSLTQDVVKLYVSPVKVASEEKPSHAENGLPLGNVDNNVPSERPGIMGSSFIHGDEIEDRSSSEKSSARSTPAQSNVLAATLLLLQSLDINELQSVSSAIKSRLDEIDETDNHYDVIKD